MSDLSPSARRLLDSARAHDRLDAAARRRLRAAVAAQLAVASVGVSAGAAHAGSLAAKADATARASWSLASLASGKGVAVCAAVAALSTTAAMTARHHVTARDAARSAKITHPTPATHSARVPERPAPAAPAPVVAVAVTPTAAGPSPSRVAPIVVAAPTAWECVRAADRALVRNDAELALRWIDRCASSDHATDSTLGVRRVAALCAAGRDGDARVVAQGLLARDRSAATSLRIERTCARGPVGGAR